MNTILLIFRLIPAPLKIETLMKLKNFKALDESLKNHYKSMLMQVDNAATTTSALIFVDQSLEFVFYLRDKELHEFSTQNFYHKCSEIYFKEYLNNIKLYCSHCPSLNKHLKLVCTSLTEA